MNPLADCFQRLDLKVDPEVLDLALTHRSWAYEHGRVPTNERLEFLGDSVLGVIVTEWIFQRYPDRPEGELAKLRASVVSGQSLAMVARQLGVGPLIKLGRGETATQGADKDSILADAMEAIIGAVHICGDFAMSRRFVHDLMDDLIAANAELGAALDWKSSLQELAASLDLGTPIYDYEATGPDHARQFFATVSINQEVIGEGHGASRRAAEHMAAEKAYHSLENE
ncbi:MAG: ribonuclease III [Propionibacteriaceae bacterium]|nr:ribonuclease III [Propionibacteriaceae bacterium]